MPKKRQTNPQRVKGRLLQKWANARPPQPRVARATCLGCGKDIPSTRLAAPCPKHPKRPT